MRRLAALFSAAVLAALVVPAAPASAHGPYCGIRWGSLPKQAASTEMASVTNVRVGRHACFDRMVIDLAGEADGYWVRYGAVHEPGRGNRVPLRGTDLEIIVVAPAYDPDTGRPTYDPRNERELRDVSGFRTFRQVAMAGTFEGQTTFGLGVRARLPFRVFTLDGPGDRARLVVDVAHRWR